MMIEQISVCWLPYFLNTLQIIIILMSIYYAIKVFIGKPNKSRVRRAGMAITGIAFAWLNFLFFAPVLISSFGALDFFVDIPIWVDVCLLLFTPIVVLGTLSYFQRTRENFHRHLFVNITSTLFIAGVPLGVMILKLIKNGTIEVAQFIIFRWVEVGC